VPAPVHEQVEDWYVCAGTEGERGINEVGPEDRLAVYWGGGGVLCYVTNNHPVGCGSVSDADVA
jgi:hypothetical protein